MANESEKILKLAQNIKQFRKNKKLSQNDFAELLCISREHLAKIETGKRCASLKLLFKTAEILEIKVKDLFDFE